MRGIVESPLAGDTVNNLRFALWCCRYLWTDRNTQAIASHMLCPWFMDDSVPAERKAGIDWEWCWSRDAKHWFFTDLGWSNGMKAARDRCVDDRIPWVVTSIAGTVAGDAFARGEWPPHTQGFQIGTVAERERAEKAEAEVERLKAQWASQTKRNLELIDQREKNDVRRHEEAIAMLKGSPQ